MGGIVYFPSFEFIDCYNYSQTTLNNHYNKTYKKGKTNYTGTCSEVAISIATDLVLRKDKNKKLDTTQIFTNVLNIAIKNNWFPYYPASEDSGPSGTLVKNINKIYSAVIKSYGIKNTVKYSSSNGFGLLKESIERGYPAVISLPSHTVVGVGYQEYTYDYTVAITYRILWWTITKYESRTFTRGYAAILNGWYYNNNTWIKNGKSSVAQQDKIMTYLTDYDLNNNFRVICYLA